MAETAENIQILVCTGTGGFASGAQGVIDAFEAEHPAVEAVVGDWTGIPVGRMVKNEMESILKLADTLDGTAWTVEAYKLMKQWGFVGVAFLWNLNFRVVAGGTEKAQWGIVDPGWGPLPAYSALASMPK